MSFYPQAAGPAIMYFTSIAMGTAKFACTSTGQVLLAVAGVVVASYSDASTNVVGVIFQCASMATDALRLNLLQRLMQGQGMGSAETLRYVAPIATFILVCFSVTLEHTQVMSMESIPWNLLFCSCGMAVCLNLIVFSLVENTSALTMSMTAPIKEVVSIVAAIALYRTQISLMQWAGYTVAMCAVVWYQWDKHFQTQAIIKAPSSC
jgi:drug/metabolite transporter (DMT)-like permease